MPACVRGMLARLPRWRCGKTDKAAKNASRGEDRKEEWKDFDRLCGLGQEVEVKRRISGWSTRGWCFRGRRRGSAQGRYGAVAANSAAAKRCGGWCWRGRVVLVVAIDTARGAVPGCVAYLGRYLLALCCLWNVSRGQSRRAGCRASA